VVIKTDRSNLKEIKKFFSKISGHQQSYYGGGLGPFQGPFANGGR
jgi:hypothetical protein